MHARGCVAVPVCGASAGTWRCDLECTNGERRTDHLRRAVGNRMIPLVMSPIASDERLISAPSSSAMCLDHALNWMEHMRIALAGRIDAMPADAPRTRPAHRARLGARAPPLPGVCATPTPATWHEIAY